MITVQLFDEQGNRRCRVGLGFRKSDTGNRILRALQEGKPGWSLGDLTRLDANLLPFSKAASLYTEEEVRGAIEARLEELNEEDAELRELRELLHSGQFVAAQGGERARDRQGRLVREWKEVVQGGARKSMSDTDIKKSGGMSRLTSAADCAVGFGWEPNDGGGTTLMRGRTGESQFSNGIVLTHARQPGHSLEINSESQAWAHKRGQQELEASKRDASPKQCTAHLMSHLADFHGV